MSVFKKTRPPQQMPDVILHLIIINVLFYLAMQTPQIGKYYDELAGYSFFSKNFRPWQVVTHLFMHSNRSIYHLGFNMFTLWMFGRVLLSVWDRKRFLFFYFSCGLGAFLLHQAYLYFTYGTTPDTNGAGGFLGASGAVYGAVVAFGTLFPNARVMLLIPPIPMKAKYMVILFIALDFFFGFSSFNTGIAHFAHLGGALTGFLIVKYWQKNSKTFY